MDVKNNSVSFGFGLFFLKKRVEFTFNLASLKIATIMVRSELGEYYTSKKVTDDQRFFLECYGAYNQNEGSSEKKYKRFTKIFKKLTFEQIEKLKIARANGEIMSTELKKALKEKSKEKKNS